MGIKDLQEQLNKQFKEIEQLKKEKKDEEIEKHYKKHKGKGIPPPHF